MKITSRKALLVLILLLVILSVLVYVYQLRVERNKKRLVELGVVREAIFWKCFKAETREARSPDWMVNNDMAGKYCSGLADQSVEGQLMARLRKGTPIKYLTDTELRLKIVNEYNKLYR